MPPEFGGKWETECLDTKLPLPTQQYIQREAKKNNQFMSNLEIKVVVVQQP